MVVERLVSGQEVNGPSAFPPTTLSSLKSMRYGAFSTALLLHFCGQCGQHPRFLFGSSKPSPTFSACTKRNTRSFFKSVGTNQARSAQLLKTRNQVGLQSSANQSIS